MVNGSGRVTEEFGALVSSGPRVNARMNWVSAASPSKVVT
jgi:hypothetical protein